MSEEFPMLETERLRLRLATADDAEAVFAVLSDEAVCRYTDVLPHRDLEQTLKVIDGRAARFANGQGIRWGIALKSDDRVIGSCGYTWNLPQARAEVGYELARSCWRRGIMAEALAAILTYGFEVRGLNRVEAEVLPENAASIQLLTDLGFTREGLLRQRWLWQERFRDLWLFSLLSTDRRPWLEGDAAATGR